jgi:hypothetical protein
MKLRYLASVVVLALTTVAAHAQAGLYLNPVAIRFSNSVADTGPFAFLGSGDTSRTFWGANYGGLYDFPHATSGLTLGIDLRGSDLHANNARLKEFLFGVRVSGQPFTRPFKPYVEASVGVGSTKAPTSSVNIDKVDYRIYAGVDYVQQRHVDFRVLEVGYGSLATISSDTLGGSASIPASGMISVSTGLVFRFP